MENIKTAEEVYDLVSKGISVNTIIENRRKKTTPLHVACQQENLEVVRAICESGITDKYLNYNLKNNGTPIEIASEVGNVEIVKYLISKGANMYESLIIACSKGKEDILDVILSFNPNLNDIIDNITPLSISCERGNINCVQKLLCAGADPNKSCPGKFNNHGNTPILSSCMFYSYNPLHICKLLVAYGANYYKVNNYGWSALHYIFKGICFLRVPSESENINERIETLKFLVGLGCDINLQDHEGNTPLMTAVFKEYDIEKVIIAFLELGANVEIANEKGETVFDLASEFGQDVIRNYLNKK